MSFSVFSINFVYKVARINFVYKVARIIIKLLLTELVS